MIACAVAILAVLVGVNADAALPCSKQLESEMQCLFTIAASTEAQLVKDRIKQAVQTCVPNHPPECHATADAAEECAITIVKNMDTDPSFAESKKQSAPAVDQCFVQYPPDVLKGFQELNEPMGHQKTHHRRHRHHNSTVSDKGAGSSSEENGTSSSGESGERGHHGHGGRHRCPHHGRRHHGPKNETVSSGERRRGGKSSSGGKSGGSSGGSSGGKSGSQEKASSSSAEGDVHAQCRKTKEQRHCIKQEIKKLANDTAVVAAMNTLVNQKKKCEQIVSWSCSAKCPRQKKCIFKATKPCRQVFMGKLETCLAKKGITLPPHLKHGDQSTLLSTPTPITV